MAIYEENLKNVLYKQLREVENAYAEKTGARSGDGSQAGNEIKRIGEGIAGVLGAAGKVAESPCDRVPVGGQQGTISDNWLDLALTEIKEFNRNGMEYINSCSEAILKAHGVVNWIYKQPRERKRIFYRGEINYGWELIPRVGRKHCKHNSGEPLKVAKSELEYLRGFQKQVRKNRGLRESIIAGQKRPKKNDPTWWALMQHYDETYGTRMIDLTSSLFCGLFFACASWNGDIDEAIDGALYLIYNEPWRKETDSPDIIHEEVVGPEDPTMYCVQDYFNVPNHGDTLRFREARGRNERFIAQDGFFVWQPKFDEPLELSNYFKFRVYREAKKHILRELYSTGYTARKIVRGSKGEYTHKRICNQIGVRPD